MTVLKFWLMPNAGFESRQTIETELAAFRKAEPGIDVAFEIASWSRTWSKLIQSIKEKSGPDVIQVGTTWIGTLGYLRAIHQLDKKETRSDHFIPAFLQMCRYFNHLGAIPWFSEGKALFYRKDILAKARIPLASLDTWHDLKNACDLICRMKQRGRRVTPLGFSAQREPGMLHDIAAFIWSFGGGFLSPDGKHSALAQFESRQGVKFLLDLIASGCISRESLEQSIEEVAERFFLHGSHAFFMASSWPLEAYLNPASPRFIGEKESRNFGVVPLPAGPAGRFNFAGGSALAVTSFSRNTDKAYRLIEFLTGKSSLGRYCASIDMLPGRTDVPATLAAPDGFLEVFKGSLDRYGRNFSAHPLWGSIEHIAVNGFAHILRDYALSRFDQTQFFKNLSEINLEIDQILSAFGE